MKVYRGAIVDNGLHSDFGPVTVEVIGADDTYPLNHVVRHSPTGFSWGYGGSGPAELARCLLLDTFPDRQSEVDQLYQRFKAQVIATLDRDRPWRLSENMVRSWAFNAAADLGLELIDREQPDDTMASLSCPHVANHRKGVPCPTCGGTP